MLELGDLFEEKQEQDTGSYHPLQLAHHLDVPFEQADIVLIGCGESRGAGPGSRFAGAPEAIRRQLRALYRWHGNIHICDLGNVVKGHGLNDSYTALRLALEMVYQSGKIAVVLGGSHELTLQQHEAFRPLTNLVNASVADLHIDLDESGYAHHRNFLMGMFSDQPNILRHYNHIGFQSYYTNPRILETLDKLRFDFFRLGQVRDSIEEMEPVLRNSDLFSFDMGCVRYSDAPANTDGSPNGFTGEEACTLMRYAGMSSRLCSLGIYGYDPQRDTHEMTARLIAQMLWYFVEGVQLRRFEARLTDRDEFIEFHVSFTSNNTTFMKSKRTGRWWMQLPDYRFVPCSYQDYLQASRDEIPERWMREQERLV